MTVEPKQNGVQGMNDLLKVTGVWKQKDKKGNTYLTGNLNQITRLTIMPNDFKKEGDKAPDYYVYMSMNKKKEGAEEKASDL